VPLSANSLITTTVQMQGCSLLIKGQEFGHLGSAGARLTGRQEIQSHLREMEQKYTVHGRLQAVPQTMCMHAFFEIGGLKLISGGGGGNHELIKNSDSHRPGPAGRCGKQYSHVSSPGTIRRGISHGHFSGSPRVQDFRLRGYSNN
jgi:hypothetical protein